ncbi:MAG: hypothetical protein ACRD0X_08465 [Thermoanaerobaculia bacterium]
MKLERRKGAPLRSLAMTAAALAVLAMPREAGACAVCYGAADSPETAGLNAAILFLLGIVAVVQAGLVAMFLAIRRRSRDYQRRKAELHLIAGGGH